MANINLVGRRRAPGVKVHRAVGQATSPGVSVSDVGFIGIAKKGPVNKRVECPNFETFEKRFGGFYNNNYLHPSVKAAFDSGAGIVHVARIVGSGAAVASTMLKSYDSGENTILVQNRDKGGGFTTEVDVLKASATNTAAFNSGSSTVTLDSVAQFEQGDLVRFGSITGGYGFVQNVDNSNKTLSFMPLAGMASGSYESGTTVVYTSTRHKARTTLTEAYSSGATVLKVANASQFNRGQRIYISDTVDGHGTAIVKNVNGNNLILASPMVSGISVANSFVVSQEFALDVYEDGVLTESHEFLSMEDESVAPNTIDHIETRISGDNNQSLLVVMTDQDAEDSITPPSHMTDFASIMAIPLTTTKAELTGGADGQTPTTSEWTGVDSSESPTGLYLFNDTNQVRFLAMPGQTNTTAIKAGIEYCEEHSTKGDCQFVADVPLANDEVDEALTFRRVTLAVNNPYCELVYPWFYVQNPEVASSNLQMPPSPFYAGLAAKAARDVGLRQNAAGVEDGSLPSTVLGLLKEVTETEHALLNEAGIIVAKFTPNFGYHFMGARTLSFIQNGFHWANIQHLANYIQASLPQIALPFVMKPNNEDTRERLSEAVYNFMFSLHRNKEFEPVSNPEEAFYVKCDEENNPKDIVNAGNLVCDVGFNGPPPAEIINFRIGRFDGKVTVNRFDS